MKLKLIILIPIILSLLISCNKKTKEKIVPNALYGKAMKQLKKGNLYDAKASLEQIEEDYPYSEYVAKADMMIAFVNYLNKEYDEMFSIAEKFIKLRPANQYAEYMYYAKALALYKQMHDQYHDQSNSMASRSAFREIIARFPESDYAKDAKIRLKKINSVIAAHQMSIGRFYLFRREYLPAIKHFNIVKGDYFDTKHAAESYYRLAESYAAMGVTKQAQYELDILLKRFPKSYWAKHIKDLTSQF